MDQITSYSLLLFSLLPLFLSIFLLKANLTTSKPSLRLPPGPWAVPIIGNIHNLLGSLPHRAMRDLSRRYGPIMLLQLGEIPTLVVSSQDTAREIMKTHDTNFATRAVTTTMNVFSYGGKNLVFAPYGEHWRQLRKICTLELFSVKRVQSFRAIREEEVNNLIRSILVLSSNNQLVNLRERLSILVNDMTVRAIIGSKCRDQDVFLGVTEKTVEITSGFNVADLFPSSRFVNLLSGMERKAKMCHQTLDRIIDNIIQEHRETKIAEGEVDDLLGVLLRIHDEGTISMDTVKAVITDVFGAGSETSTTTLDWAMSELMRNPQVMEKAQLEVRQLLQGRTNIIESDLDKLNYLHLVIKETLRLHAPVPLLLPRQCQETCRISGYDIPKGATVMVNAWAIGRDPKYWDDAEEFKPERFKDGNTSNVDFKGLDFQFIPFGAGRRICPGISFGLANVELPLANLLYHFDWKLPDGMRSNELDMTESFGITARRRSAMWLHAVPYVRSFGKNEEGSHDNFA